jgi:peptidoglycan hydrolase CwlO-like protein
MDNIPISEVIVAIVTGIITWFTAGKFTATTSEIQNAREVLTMWKETSSAQKEEIENLKQDMLRMGTRIFELESTISKLQGENQFLKDKLKEFNINID